MTDKKRLIDANAFIQYFENAKNKAVFLPGELREILFMLYSEIKTEIEKQPTVDAVEVVRCKDCVHYGHGTSCVCDLHSEETGCYGGGFQVQMLPNDFCSHGERRTDK